MICNGSLLKPSEGEIASPPEAKLLLFLKENYDDCKAQVRFEWCRFSKTNSIMPFDFVLSSNKIIIELDGKQHFNQVLNWESPEIIQERDIEKINNSINNGHSIIRIYQPDVWNDKYHWKKTLNKTINEIKESGTQIVFISSNNCYDVYQTHLSSDIKINHIKY
jgi:very-short-patch-repair endonuclease